MNRTHTRRLLTLAVLLGALCRPLPAAAAAEPARYNGEIITDLYSFEAHNRTCHRITDEADIARAAAFIAERKPVDRFQEDAVGFLVFTEEGKYTFYASPSDKTISQSTGAMIVFSQQMNLKYPGNAHWLAYMSVENIERITYSGRSGGQYTRDPQKYPKEFHVDVDTTDREEIARIARYLKEMEIDRYSNAYAYKGAHNYGIPPYAQEELFHMTIYFREDVEYVVAGPYFGIIATDLEERVSYEGNNEDMFGLRDLMADLPGAARRGV